MERFIFKFVNGMKLRGKMLVVVLPLVIVPIFVVGSVIGYIATEQARLGITHRSKDDLDHMARFTIDLLEAHHQQFQAYKQDKKKTIREELKYLTNLAYSLVEAQDRAYLLGRTDLETAKEEARRSLKEVNVGESGYIYAMTSTGDLKVHIAREGENVYEETDENGRHFIRTMCRTARQSQPGEVLYIVYPWRNETLGDEAPREKIVAYRYFPEWDWIIATGGYLEETYEDLAFEKKSFETLKSKIQSKKVGQTGYIFCMDREGTLRIHTDAEGENILASEDSNGVRFIKTMVEEKSGWIRYPWQNVGEDSPRMKVVRYRYFEPWDWVVAVGSYEDEFYREADTIESRILSSLAVISIFVCFVSIVMVYLAARVLTEPIHHMIAVIRKVKEGRFEKRMQIDSGDELGELASTFNRMTEIIKRNQEMETNLAQQSKMASLGVLSSGVAHEINNPLGVILGYAGYLEGKLSEDDPNYRFIHEIKRESKRCKKIVQDLLSYARTPKPTLEETDINALLSQIAEFAANHTDMYNVSIVLELLPTLPRIMADGDQLRQVAINLILNSGNAMEEGGELVIGTEVEKEGVSIRFKDSGAGIAEEHQEKIFEPFYTTKTRGTGLGLPITKQIVEQHHGTITLESRIDEGTTVTIWLPLAREEFY